jgi:hypothetical protein
VTAFTQDFLFLRNPAGGVEDLDLMASAGFQGVYCNVGDYPLSQWEAVVRPRAQAQGMTCGVWLRTADQFNNFAPDRLAYLVECADRWICPLIVNSESEIKGSGSVYTRQIADRVGARDAAVSVEAWPFANVDWTPVGHLPILPQIFPEAGDLDINVVVSQWWAYGVKCVYCTYATYGGRGPSDYDLVSPYSLYTADDCHQNYARWRATGSGFHACQETPDGGDDVTTIGSQDGIKAAVNRLRDLDSGGTLLVKDASGKWPDISTLTQPLDQWRAYDKLQRTLQVLKEDHDAQAAA